jgi:hypothetical protein
VIRVLKDDGSVKYTYKLDARGRITSLPFAHSESIPILAAPGVREILLQDSTRLRTLSVTDSATEQGLEMQSPAETMDALDLSLSIFDEGLEDSFGTDAFNLTSQFSSLLGSEGQTASEFPSSLD